VLQRAAAVAARAAALDADALVAAFDRQAATGAIS